MINGEDRLRRRMREGELLPSTGQSCFCRVCKAKARLKRTTDGLILGSTATTFSRIFERKVRLALVL